MPIRGKRSIWPEHGVKPTGILSTRGSQKLDPTPNVAVQKYALGAGTRSKPGGSGDKELRHQKPVKQW